eukprot:1142034-Pelagomonas_calceolata.AAC.1
MPVKYASAALDTLLGASQVCQCCLRYPIRCQPSTSVLLEGPHGVPAKYASAALDTLLGASHVCKCCLRYPIRCQP